MFFTVSTTSKLVMNRFGRRGRQRQRRWWRRRWSRGRRYRNGWWWRRWRRRSRINEGDIHTVKRLHRW